MIACLRRLWFSTGCKVSWAKNMLENWHHRVPLHWTAWFSGKQVLQINRFSLFWPRPSSSPSSTNFLFSINFLVRHECCSIPSVIIWTSMSPMTTNCVSYVSWLWLIGIAIMFWSCHLWTCSNGGGWWAARPTLVRPCNIFFITRMPFGLS